MTLKCWRNSPAKRSEHVFLLSGGFLTMSPMHVVDAGVLRSSVAQT